jgi:formylmethanofuran dehydrogenase subunit B
MVRRANSVLVTGRIYTVESARSAIDFARRFDALIDPWDSDGAFDAIASMQRVGGYSVSLGEARDRSDLWIVIGDDRVLEQTPRLPEAMRCGRAVPVLLLGRWSDSSIQAWSDAGFQTVCIETNIEQLPRILSQTIRLGSEYCDSQTGKWILNAKYTTVLYAPQSLDIQNRDLWIDLIHRWVLQRNETTRIATLAWANLQATFHQTCTWLTGFPGRIRFENQSAQFEPNRYRAKDWCGQQASEPLGLHRPLLVWVDDSVEEFPREFESLGIPKIAISPRGCSPGLSEHVWLPTGIAGLNYGANMFRGDQTILAKVTCKDPKGYALQTSPTDWLERLTR